MDAKGFCVPDRINEYDVLYDEISASLDTIEQEELFDDCLKRCEQIFKIAEVDYGKKPRNLPYDYLHDVAVLYKGRQTEYGFNFAKSLEKYDAETEYLNYAMEKSFSLEDLSTRISPPNDWNGTQELGGLEKINKYHMEDFFGVKYKGNLPDENKYELVRLLKVLYDCKIKTRVDLGYLKRASFIRSRSQIPSTYQEAILYIKRKLSKRLDFETIIQLEHFNSILRNCIRLLSEGIVEHQLRYISYAGCAVHRHIRTEVYTIITKNLKDNNKVEKPEQSNIPIHIKAYINFIEWGVKDEVEALNSREVTELMNIEEQVYRWVDLFSGSILNVNKNNLATCIDVYVKESKRGLAEFIVQRSKIEHKDKIRISKSSSDYEMMVYIYNFGMNRYCHDNISQRDFLLLIYLYERCKRKRVKIPIDEGFQRNKNRRQFKIHYLMKKLWDCHQDRASNFLEGKEEYISAIYWLIHKIHMIMTYRNTELDLLEREMKHNLSIFLKRNIPLLCNENSPYRTINDIANALISEKELLGIRETTKNKAYV